MILNARTVSALVGAFVIAGCAAMPDMRSAGAPPRSPLPRAEAAPVMTPQATPGAVSASAAETACMQQGQGQGLAVQGVVGTREAAGADGVARSRDVMLRVARGQQVYEVRCSYSYASGEARIMSL